MTLDTRSRRFAGRTVVVTGAGSGIGRTTAIRLAGEGGRVVAVDVDGSRLEALAAEHPLLDLVTVTADLTDEDDVQAVFAAAGETVDALANVAGVMDRFLPLHELDDATWSRVMDVNVTAVMRMCRAAIVRMLPAGRGAIVNISSEAGIRGSAGGLAYTTSKHAVHGITRNCSFMYADKGIRVNTVAPGPTSGSNIDPTRGSEYGAAYIDHIQRTIMPPFARSSALAASIAWLLSDEAENVTGVLLPSDGGWSAI
ncbi:SDR family NAD(P)-dependent oxidoreductase [Microbacterium sp. No. 7]|uniref:SDR family NAD(P)-dependent oxidoreductase n=1 Tax=Microbacterium sp. No. 7 TaxID=1714373 RepID=UPI0006D13AFD|nr:SDR family oxidoreductase [Microbacterium sp. No. 7]ALJ18877.1 short-chain dehydrogenase [Microbacterium sp. No. 7]